jgi:DNA-binding MarR family transcriptional regulator/GNAT superfamily N-acetyltransferase
MQAEHVAGVRRFNRTVTQRVGALQEGFLSRPRPLGQSRVLWEIGPAGAELRDLRARLDLDSGYLTRLLDGLVSAGLATIAPDVSDARVRTARLTPAGLAERRELDRLSDEQAEEILSPLNERQRAELVDAMGTVERLLAASLVRFELVDPADPDARRSIAAFFGDLDSAFEGGFDAGRSDPADDAELRDPAGLFLIARLHGEAIGCGGLTLYPGGVAEIRRVWISAAARGLGLGRRLLVELEGLAAAHGSRLVRLDTNRALTAAITLYRSAGYREVPAFNTEHYAHHWFEKELSP